MPSATPTGRSPLSRRAVAGGTITALIMVFGGLAAALVLRELLSWTKGTASTIASAAAIAGFVLGGFRAGLLEVRAPLTNGAAAAAAAGLISSIGQRLAFGKSINPLAILVVVILAASCGIFGGFVSNTAARQRGLK